MSYFRTFQTRSVDPLPRDPKTLFSYSLSLKPGNAAAVKQNHLDPREKTSVMHSKRDEEYDRSNEALTELSTENASFSQPLRPASSLWRRKKRTTKHGESQPESSLYGADITNINTWGQLVFLICDARICVSHPIYLVLGISSIKNRILRPITALLFVNWPEGLPTDPPPQQRLKTQLTSIRRPIAWMASTL